MNYFIPNDHTVKIDKKSIFVLTRPFYSNGVWVKKGSKFDEWELDTNKTSLVEKVENADVLLIPYPINYYFQNGHIGLLEKYNGYCESNNIKGYGFITGDYGMVYPDLKNITYFRMGGFKSKLSNNNKGFPASLSDYHKRYYKSTEILIRPKNEKPKVGFCGHATNNPIIRIHQILNYLKVNIKRFIENPSRIDYEPYFQSAFERYRLLKNFETAKNIDTEFIYRTKYRAGARNLHDQNISTMEFYDNIRNSDYIFCLRGTGNFSIRLYETLMMGRIPIFFNTDCVLPFMDYINWKNHVVWIDWNKKGQAIDILMDFHSKLSDSNFQKMQSNNRKLWEEKLQPKWIFSRLK